MKTNSPYRAWRPQHSALLGSAPNYRSRAVCLAAADALDGAWLLLDDDESAEIVARLADQWRTEAEEAPNA